MRRGSTSILVALGLLLVTVGLLLVTYSDGENHGERDGESHSEGAIQKDGVRPPLTAGPSAPAARDPRVSPTAPSTNSANPSVTASATMPGRTPSPSGSGSTADILLAQQIVATQTGGGVDGNCIRNDTPASPTAYISNFPPNEGPKIELARSVGVCLRGFDPAAPVWLTVDVGRRSYQTEIRLTNDEAESEFGFDFIDRPEALFDGVPLTAFRVSGEGAHRTTIWDFVPPSEVRDTIVSVVLTASQGELSSQVVQPVNIQEEPGQLKIGPREFAVWGFPVGRRVEIGLYRGIDRSDAFSLVRRVGVVTMPALAITVFIVPEDVIREAGGNPNDYCLSAPLEMATDCFFS